ncbi:hypothetical protein AMJ80_02570, partial [bacterium SM23_31]
MGKIKVLYIHEVSRIGGGETWFLNFIDGLQNPDIEPILLCPEGPFAEAARSKGVEVIPYKFRFYDISSHRLLKYLLFGFFRVWDSFAIGRIIKRYNINLVHTVNTNGHVIGSLIRTFYSKKVVWHIHHDHQKILYRFFKPDYMVFVAQFRIKKLQSLRLENKRKYSVLYNGIDTSLYEKINTFEKQPLNVSRRMIRLRRIGYVGRLLPEKGLETFLTAASLIIKKYPDIKFNIYGEEIYDEVLKGQYTAFLKQKISELGLDDAVRLCGFVFPQTEIFSSINIFVIPSYMESCPMVILESWAA